ncbi:MAG TPA: lysozyme [Burkholderiales bacterium]|nr:lysozyme [Burkholderiales bacterium]
MSATHPSDEGLRLIAEFEGFVGHLYDDPAGNATIGYGHLIHLGPYHRTPGACPLCDQYRAGITEDEGRRLLAVEAQPYADVVVRTSRPLRQCELDALTSFAYNVGQGGYINSDVRREVNRNGDVCAALRQVVHGSDGKVYPGLVRRRDAECALFYKPSEEEDEMRPFLAWDKDRQRAYLIGPWGAAWITQAADVQALEALYGKTAVAFSASTIDAIGAAR